MTGNSDGSRMIAAWPASAGGPEVITVGARPRPAPGPGQALIETRFAGVNRHDVNQRARGSGPAGATDILGLEVSGVIAAVGEGMDPARIGEEVCALVDGGGYGQACIADASLILPRTPLLSLREAAALPEALFTGWFNVIELGRLKAGDWLLVHGGASGVGSLTIQLARQLGAHVIATAGSPEKCDACRAFGADAAVNYRTGDFVAIAREVTGGHGADVILDMVGGDYAEKNLAALAMDGRILHLASGHTPIWSAPLRLIMEKRAIVSGSLLRPLPLQRKSAIVAQLLAHVWPALGEAIRPRIDAVFPLRDAQAAHRRMETGAQIGKILIDCMPE